MTKLFSEKRYKKKYKLVIKGYPDMEVGSKSQAKMLARFYRNCGFKVKIIPIRNGRAFNIGKFEYIGPY